MNESKKNESSTVAALKGFSAPFGVRIVKRKRKVKGNNVSKPFGEPELFENAVAMAELENKSVAEVVKKSGSRYVVKNDKTGSTIGSYDKASDAWEKQRLFRKQNKSKSATEKQPKSKSKAQKAPKSKLAPKPKKAPKSQISKTKKEQFLNTLKTKFAQILKEGSMLSYVFEQNPTSSDSINWEKFISRLSKETVMSDPKLKSILQAVAKSEAKILGSSVNALKGILDKTGQFEVEQRGVGQDDRGDVAMNFTVKMLQSGAKLPFAIKIENGRPLILFPEESRNKLNSMGTDDSKLLRAEMMHAQETVFDNMHDVVNATTKRDEYLKNMENKIDKAVGSMGPLEMALLKNLLKQKYR